MSEDLQISTEVKLSNMSPSSANKGIIEGETDQVPIGQCIGRIKRAVGWLWTGFYIVKENELVLGHSRGLLPAT